MYKEGEGNQQTGLQGLLLLNYQHQHFHHILHLSKLPYQQHDLKAVQETTISAFWRTIKRCQTRFLLHCFGSACQRIKHYLKEEPFSREKGLARFTDDEEGAHKGSASGYVGNQGAQKKWEHDKKSSGGWRVWCGGDEEGRSGRVGSPTFLPGSLLGTWRLRCWSCSTQVSCSSGPSVQLGSSPKPPDCLPQRGERWRRHKVTVAEMPTGETK